MNKTLHNALKGCYRDCQRNRKQFNELAFARTGLTPVGLSKGMVAKFISQLKFDS